jgi:[ribosomal protein S5]-alanine N-acetyltransferase
MFPQLTTERLCLQPITNEDQQFIFKGLSHPDVIPFYGVQYTSFESAKAQTEWYDKIWAEGSGIPWKIVDRTSGEKLGVLSVYYYKPEHNKAEVGFWLMPSHWNRGIALESLNAAIDYWQSQKNLHRLEAFVEEGNHASSKVLEKAGFVYEGTMKDCEFKNGNYISLLIYALILK